MFALSGAVNPPSSDTVFVLGMPGVIRFLRSAKIEWVFGILGAAMLQILIRLLKLMVDIAPHN